MRITAKLCVTAVVSLTSLNVHASARQVDKTSTPTAPPDVCSLLTKADIAAVQKDELQDTRASSVPTSGLVMEQCLYRTRNAPNSVTLVLATADPAARPQPKLSDFWNRRFHDGGTDREDGDEGSQPKAVAGVGDEAFWVGNALAGALYVRRGEQFVRVSVGGVKKLDERIERSKVLARAALKKLW